MSRGAQGYPPPNTPLGVEGGFFMITNLKFEKQVRLKSRLTSDFMVVYYRDSFYLLIPDNF